MFNSTKQLFSKRILPVVKTIKMFSDQKNIKISQDTHKRLKVFAAQNDLTISDCADLLLELIVTNHDISKSQVEEAIKAKKQPPKT